MSFGEVYEAAVDVVNDTKRRNPRGTTDTFHLSPGTPAMAAVWIILAKTRFPAELIESSKEHGVRTASVPFDLAAEFIPDLLRGPDERLARLSAGLPPAAPEFDAIVHRCREMRRVIAKARRVAVRSIPILLEGESGTGKELLARAIHESSPRRGRDLIAVNCGAIPSDLVESELFGHKRGAFTGATSDRRGYFEAADGSTLFLDEVGELPMATQVKLLRVLDNNAVVPVGDTRVVKVDVRIIAATNRVLTEEITAGRFREDLFYRLAVAVLQLPPLRSRPGDLGLLVDRLLVQIIEESSREPGFGAKELSVGARNLLLGHTWPGNVRELANTLRRAAVWSEGPVISADDVREALLLRTDSSAERILDRPLQEGVDLPSLLRRVAKHYLDRALKEAGGNKTRAASLVGLSSYQTFTNWLRRYGTGSGTGSA